MRISQPITVTLPPEMAKEVERVRKAEHRTRSELFREALRRYFISRLPVETATPAELRAIGRGRAAYARGDYATLDELSKELGRPRRRPRQKVA